MTMEPHSLRSNVFAYIKDAYGVQPDYPWARYPDYAVFRHQSNRKWFALIMRIPKSKLGLPDEAPADVLNLKLESALAVDFLTQEPGFFPGYHISRGSWISVLLDGTVPPERIFPLIDQSFAVTAVKPKKKQNTGAERKPNKKETEQPL